MYSALRILFYINNSLLNCEHIFGTVNWTKVVPTDGNDGHELKIEKIGRTFIHVLMLCLQKSQKLLLWLVLLDEVCLIFFITPQEYFV